MVHLLSLIFFGPCRLECLWFQESSCPRFPCSHRKWNQLPQEFGAPIRSWQCCPAADSCPASRFEKWVLIEQVDDSILHKLLHPEVATFKLIWHAWFIDHFTFAALIFYFTNVVDPITYCYGEIGCITIDDSWYDPLHRPINQEPLPREKINTRFILHTRERPTIVMKFT